MTVRSAGLGTAVSQTISVVLIAIGGFVSVATVVAFFGNTWWVFDYLANFRWHFNLGLVSPDRPCPECQQGDGDHGGHEPA